MNFLSRLWNKFTSAIAGGLGYVSNRYEAATQFWGNRRWLWSSYQDARLDTTRATAIEIIRKHMDLVCNTPFIQRIRNLKIQFAVGIDGLIVVPNASSPSMEKAALELWNAARTASWERWCASPELGSNLTMCELTIQWEGMLFDTGNIIVQKTRDEYGRPKIQTIDFLRLQTPPGLASEEGKTIISGIRLKKINVPVVQINPLTGKKEKIFKEVVTGKPESYFIREEFDQNSFQEIPASDIIHKFRALRPGQMIGIPEAAPGINTIIDYTDLHILEMRAAKDSGKIANVTTNAAGEFDVNQSRKVPLTIQGQLRSGTVYNKPTEGYYQVDLGESSIAMRHGDKIENFQVRRPEVCQFNYWTLKQSEICQAYNVPLLLVAPYSLQGTVARFDVDIAAGAFRSDFEIIASLLKEVYDWHCGWDVKYNIRAYDGISTPENPCNCIIRPPRPPNADIGYTADALAKELEMGTKTFQDVCAERNLNWVEVLEENAKYKATKDSVEKRYGVGGTSGAVDFENLKQEFDSYGVGVRAGTITPTIEDENYFRAKAGLPPLSQAAKEAWTEDGFVRRPITLQSQDAFKETQDSISPEGETATEKAENQE